AETAQPMAPLGAGGRERCWTCGQQSWHHGGVDPGYGRFREQSDASALPTMTIPNAQTGGQEVPAQFRSGGPDAEAYGASAGYPKGARTTLRGIGSLLGVPYPPLQTYH